MQSHRIPKAVPYVTVQHLRSNTKIPIGKPRNGRSFSMGIFVYLHRNNEFYDQKGKITTSKCHEKLD